MTHRERLAKLLGSDKVSRNPTELHAAARDLWPRALQLDLAGRLLDRPLAVVHPESTEDVKAAVRFCREERIPLVPYGGGSGVVGGATAPNGAIVLDLKRMSAVVDLDRISWLVTAEAGIVGENLERHLQAAGATLSHFPSSIYCSTLGGWIAARSSGQLSTRYGSIERRLVGIEAVLGTGELLRIAPTPRSAAGPDLLGLFTGSEGTLGIITKATLRAHPEPEERTFAAFRFQAVSPALAAIRRIIQSGCLPAAVRLYDELDTLLSGSKGKSGPFSSLVSRTAARSLSIAFRARHRLGALVRRAGKGCLLIMTFEGPAAARESNLSALLCSQENGQPLGPEPARHWWEHRYDVSFKQSEVLLANGILDTIEVSAPWNLIEPLYATMRRTMLAHALVMAHFSHAYSDGCSIYFTFAAVAKTVEERVAIYDKTWTAALQVCREVGATITHHHGVGRLKAQAFQEERGETGMALLRGLKRACDPDGILNPGVLGL